MSEYLVTLIGMSILVSAVSMISPNKEKKYTRLVCTLCLLCVILKPLPSFFDSETFSSLSFGNFSEESDKDESFYNEIYNNTVREANEGKIAEALEGMMSKDIGLPEGEFEVRVKIDDSQGYVKVTKATVIIKKGAVAYDPKKIVDYLAQMLDCQCQIIYE